MATVGQQLLSPESGWQRIENDNANISYIGNWATATAASYSGGSMAWTSVITEYNEVRFRFTGTKFRFITRISPSDARAIKLYIDGILIQTIDLYKETAVYVCLAYENTSLSSISHNVRLVKEVSDTGWFIFDAIDISSTGAILPYTGLNEKTSISDMQVGDYISCEYTATSGAFGSFSNLGSATKSLIPAASSATPDGSFYWIHAGYDNQNRMKLVADRNIAHTISWDVLNTAGLCDGEGLDISQGNWTVGDGGATIQYTNNRFGYSPNLIEYKNELYAVYGETYNVSPYYQQIRVKKWNGSTWTWADGGTATGLSGSTYSAQAPITFIYNNYLYVGWLYVTSNYNYIMKKYDGTSWTDVNSGNNVLPENTYQQFSMYTALFNNVIYLIYNNQDGSKLLQFNGNTFSFVEFSAGTNLITYNDNKVEASHIITYNNKLYISLSVNYDGSYKQMVLTYNGTTFEYENIVFNYNTLKNARFSHLEILNNRLFIFWKEYNQNNVYQLRYACFYDGSWHLNETSLNYDVTKVCSGTIATVIVNGYMFVAWVENSVTRCKQFDGTLWTTADNYLAINVDATKMSYNYFIYSFQKKLCALLLESDGTRETHRFKYKNIFAPANTKTSIRLLTGGTASTDLDNEWDKIIVSSTLNGNITAGNDAVWNWSGSTSWTSTCSSTNTSRVYRGSSSVSNYANTATTSASSSAYSFRPVLLISPTGTPTPSITYDKTLSSHNNPIQITGTITDSNSLKLQYRVIVNGYNQVIPWTTVSASPINLNVTVPTSALLPGVYNRVTVEYRNLDGNGGFYSKQIIFYNPTTITVGNIALKTEGANTFLYFSVINSDGHEVTYNVGQYNNSDVLTKTIKSVTVDPDNLNGGKISVT